MTEALLKDCTESEFGTRPHIQSCPCLDDSDFIASISSNRICYYRFMDGYIDMMDRFIVTHTGEQNLG